MEGEGHRESEERRGAATTGRTRQTERQQREQRGDGRRAEQQRARGAQTRHARNRLDNSPQTDRQVAAAGKFDSRDSERTRRSATAECGGRGTRWGRKHGGFEEALLSQGDRMTFSG